MADLTAETTYYLNVTINGVPQFASPYPSFTTFPPSGTSRNFNFVVLTDFRTVHPLLAHRRLSRARHRRTLPLHSLAATLTTGIPQRSTSKRQMFKDLYDPKHALHGRFRHLILRHMPIIHQWDDHDSGLNNLDKNYPDWNLSQQAFQVYVPSYPLPSVTPGIWQKFSYAQVECFVLDCRSQRDSGARPGRPG